IGLYANGDLILHAPEAALTVPDSLPVTAVIGLDDSAALVTHSAPPSPAFVNGRPCSAYWNEKNTGTTATLDGTALPSPAYPYAPCGPTPTQLQGASGISGAIANGNDGRNQTVAIIDAYASPTIADDVNTYSQRNGVPQMNGGQFRQVVAPGTFKRPVSGA